MKRNATAIKPVAGFQALSEDEDGFQALSQILHRETGIQMEGTTTNRLKMANRLSRVLSNYGFSTYTPYLKKLREGDPALLAEFISALTTNTTSFFREPAHFEALKSLLPGVCRNKQAQGPRELRIWSAAASTGEEVYSIAITVLESLPLGHGLDVKILGTDIDREALARASAGKFTGEQLNEVPEPLRKRYFRPLKTREGNKFQVDQRVRAMIRFAPLNLRAAAYPFRFPFDIVFCRNVLIYFDAKTSYGVIDKLAESLTPKGLLFIGHAELGLVRSSSLKPLRMGVYQRAARAPFPGGASQ